MVRQILLRFNGNRAILLRDDSLARGGNSANKPQGQFEHLQDIRTAEYWRIAPKCDGSQAMRLREQSAKRIEEPKPTK